MNDKEAIAILRRCVDQPSPQRVHNSIAAIQPLDDKKIRGLIAALNDDDASLRLLVVEILSELDPIDSSLPALIHSLEDPDRIIRIAAVDVHLDQLNAAAALGDLREVGAEAIPMLGKILTDKDAVTRSEAASAISKITGDPTVEITVVVALLRADDWLDRYVAAEHLGCLGGVAAPALPHLHRTLADEDAAVRTAVKMAIERIEGA